MQKLIVAILLSAFLANADTVKAYTPIKNVPTNIETSYSDISLDSSRLYTRPLFDGPYQRKLDLLTSKEWVKMTQIAIPLMVSGVAFEWAKQPNNDLRNA